MDPQAIIAALTHVNDQFYRALSLADFNAMQRLWLESEAAVCVHPGWTPLYGWDAIRESWRSIFANQGPVHIWPTEVEVRVFGLTAEVNCVENMDAGQIAGTGVVQTRARNVFRRVNDEWKMLQHYAAPGRGVPRPLEPFSSN
jgi:ketosteroid isomerase-like protein